MAVFQKFKAGTALMAGVLVLSACVNLPKLKDKELRPSNFDQELAREYLEFSDSEARQYDWIDSDFFARKGLKAAKGMQPIPEIPSKWRTPDDKLAELVQARQVLVQALTPENKAAQPVKLARAQRFYDCWVEQQEENWQPDDIASCRQQFIDAMAQLGEKPDAKQAPYTIVDQATVYFDFDRAVLDSEADGIIQGVVDVLNKLDSYKLTLGGHTDSSGSNAYNKRLAERRVLAVRQKLINQYHVDPSRIIDNAFGEGRLKVRTGDGVKERMNRRVEIYVIQ